VSTQKDEKIYVHVLNWNAPLLALPPVAGKIAAAHMLVGNTAVDFRQSENGIVLNVPPAKNDETDRIVVLTIAK
jgi:alpha-L-fucosidase